MKTIPMTDYFRNDVLIKRPYIQLEWCQEALSNAIYKDIQPDRRFKL